MKVYDIIIMIYHMMNYIRSYFQVRNTTRRCLYWVL